MNEQIKEVYEHALEKYAGDHEAAKKFVVGFIKEAAGFGDAAGFGGSLISGAGKAVGGGLVGIGLGLGLHGMSQMLNSSTNSNLHEKFMQVLNHVVATNSLLSNADRARIDSYAETIFKFAPRVATDPNLLSSILSNAVHGEGIDPMTIRTLTDLESKIQETRKNALFSPKAYT
jgi:hypothetical protein